MRFLFLTLLALSLVGCASTPKAQDRPVVIKEIKPRYMAEEQFKRIAEYWTGKENTGGRLILRSDADERSGYYFTLILNQKLKKLPRGTVVLGEFYAGASLDVQSYEFPLPNRLPKNKEIFIGLTGEDAPADQRAPAAWRFTLKAPSGEVLAQKQSYLWEL